jgi:hypothetical protein
MEFRNSGRTFPYIVRPEVLWHGVVLIKKMRGPKSAGMVVRTKSVQVPELSGISKGVPVAYNPDECAIITGSTDFIDEGAIWKRTADFRQVQPIG